MEQVPLSGKVFSMELVLLEREDNLNMLLIYNVFIFFDKLAFYVV